MRAVCVGLKKDRKTEKCLKKCAVDISLRSLDGTGAMSTAGIAPCWKVIDVNLAQAIGRFTSPDLGTVYNSCQIMA
jgi:hypothetical protein